MSTTEKAVRRYLESLERSPEDAERAPEPPAVADPRLQRLAELTGRPLVQEQPAEDPRLRRLRELMEARRPQGPIPANETTLSQFGDLRDFRRRRYEAARADTERDIHAPDDSPPPIQSHRGRPSLLTRRLEQAGGDPPAPQRAALPLPAMRQDATRIPRRPFQPPAPSAGFGFRPGVGPRRDRVITDPLDLVTQPAPTPPTVGLSAVAPPLPPLSTERERFAEQGRIPAVASAALRGVGQIATSVGGTLRAIDTMIPEERRRTPAAVDALIQRGLEIQQDPALAPSSRAGDLAKPQPLNPDWWLEGLAQLGPQMAGQVALGLIAGPLAFAAPTLVLEGGSAMVEAEAKRIARGEKPADARARAALEALFTGTGAALLEVLPGEALFGEAGKALRRNFWLKGGVPALTEGGTEFAQSLLGAKVSEVAGSDPEAMQGAVGRAAAEGLLGMGAGGVAGALTPTEPAVPRETPPAAGPLEALLTGQDMRRPAPTVTPETAPGAPESVQPSAPDASARVPGSSAEPSRPGLRERVARALAPELAQRADQTEQERREARRDALTRAMNRRAFEEDREAIDADSETAVLYADLGNLKALNEHRGHEAGDAAIRRAVDALIAGGADPERTYRLGGDEFAVAVPRAQAEQIRRRAMELFGEQPAGGSFTSRLDIAAAPTYAEAESAVRAAKAARPSEQQYRDVRRGPAATPSAAAAIAQGVVDPAVLGSGDVARLRPADIDLAPQELQYKLGVDASGVTQELRSIRRWDPDLAGVMLVWRHPRDGRLKVVNGHHRLERAKALSVPDVLVRVIAAPDAQTARSIGALTNIAEGRGTPIDAAKIVRDMGWTAEDLEARGISLRGQMARRGVALANLHPSLFQQVVNQTMPLQRAVLIGEADLTPEQQLSLVELTRRKGVRLTNDELAELIRFVKGAGESSVTQASLFGEETLRQSNALQKAELSAYVKAKLGKDRRLFKFLTGADRATRIEGEGAGQIDVEKAGAVASDAAQAEEIYVRLSNMSGPIATALNGAAAQLAQGGNKDAIKRQLLGRVRELVTEIAQGRGAGRAEAALAGRAGATGPVRARSEEESGTDGAEEAGFVDPDQEALLDPRRIIGRESRPSPDSGPRPEPLHEIPSDGDLVARIYSSDRGFAVTFWDTDADMQVSDGPRIFPTEGRALEWARSQMSGGATGPLLDPRQADMFGAAPRDDVSSQTGLDLGSDRPTLAQQEARARATVDRLRPFVERGRASPEQRDQYREALALLRRGQGQSEEEARLRSSGEHRPELPGQGTLFDPAESAGDGFAANSRGEVDFGEIDEATARRIRRQAGPVRLTRERAEHIWEMHGAELRTAGFESPEAFVEHVLEGYSEVRQSKGSSLLLVRRETRDRLVAVRLTAEPGGDFYSVRTGWIQERRRTDRDELLGEPTRGDSSGPDTTARLASSRRSSPEGGRQSDVGSRFTGAQQSEVPRRPEGGALPDAMPGGTPTDRRGETSASGGRRTIDKRGGPDPDTPASGSTVTGEGSADNTLDDVRPDAVPTDLRTEPPPESLGDASTQRSRISDRLTGQLERPARPPKRGERVNVPMILASLQDVARAAAKELNRTAGEGDVPLRPGRLGTKRARGIYKPHAEVVRIGQAGNVPTATHELAGHALEKILFGWPKGGPWKNQVSRPMLRELVKLGKLLYGNTKPAGGYAREGWAEFTRLWVTEERGYDGRTLRDTAPQFLGWFESTFRQRYPETFRALERSRDLTRRWKQLGSYGRALESVVDPASPRERARRGAAAVGRVISMEAMVEMARPFDLAARQAEARLGRDLEPEDDPFALITAFRTTHARRARYMVEDGMIDLAGQLVGPSLEQALAPVRSREQDMILYLWARRTLVLSSDPDGSRDSGLSTEDALQIIRELDSPVFQLAATKLYEWGDGVLNYAAQASPTFRGVVEHTRAAEKRRAEAAAERYGPDLVHERGNYIPLQRVFEDLDRQWATANRGGPSRTSPVQRIRGSGRRIKHPLQTLISNAESIVKKAHERAVIDALVRLSRVEGMGNWVEEVEPDKVPAAQATFAELIKRMNDQLFWTGSSLAVKIEDLSAGQDPNAANDLTGRALTFFADAQRAPTGELIYPVRDEGRLRWFAVNEDLFKALRAMDVYRMPAAADLLLGKPARAFRAGTTGLRASFGLLWNPLRDFQTFYVNTRSHASGARLFGEWMRAVGEMALARTTGKRTEWVDFFFRVGGEMAQPLGQDIPHTRRAARRLFEGRVVRTIDPRNWFDIYRDLIQFPEAAARIAEMKLIAAEIGWSPGQPMTLGQSMQLLTAAKQVTTDFTAAGSIARVFNQIAPFHNAAIQGPRAHLRAARARPMKFALRGLQLTALTLLMWWRHKDEEWWTEMDPRERFLNWHFPIDWPEPTLLRLPRAFEVGLIFSGLPEMLADAWYREDPQGFTEWFRVFVESSFPNMTPPVLEEIGEQLANRDSYFDRPIETRGEQNRPAEERYNEYTSRAAIALGRLFKKSPKRIDHAIEGLFGQAAGDLLNVLGLGPQGVKREQELADLPVVGRAFHRGGRLGTGGKSVEEMYDLLDAALKRRYSSRGETEKEREQRLQLQDAADAVTAVMYVRRHVPRTEIRAALTVEATKYARDAVRADQRGILVREHFAAARRRNEKLRDEIEEALRARRAAAMKP